MQTDSIEVQRLPVVAPWGQAVGPWVGLFGQRYMPPIQAQAPPRLGSKQPSESVEQEAPSIASGPQIICPNKLSRGASSIPPRMPLSPRSAPRPPSGKRRKTVPPEPPEPPVEPDSPPEPDGAIKPTRPQATAKSAKATKTCARVLLPMSLLTYVAERPENTRDFRKMLRRGGDSNSRYRFKPV